MNRIERLRRELENQAEQRIPQRRAGIGSRLGSMALGLGAGALGAYLLDPERGRSRRARLADQAAALARRWLPSHRTIDTIDYLVAAATDRLAARL